MFDSRNFNRAFFWYYVLPSAAAGGLWAAAPLPPFVLGVFLLSLAVGQVWMVRGILIRSLFRWAAIPVVSGSILAVGMCFAIIGYAFVRVVLGHGITLR